MVGHHSHGKTGGGPAGGRQRALASTCLASAESKFVTPLSLVRTMAFPRTFREHLVALLHWSDAHVSFDGAIAELPAAARGKAPKGLPYSPWQLVEHIRLTQADILEFCGSSYREKRFPDDLWPKSAKPRSARAWNASIAQIRRDRRTLERLARNPRRNLTARLPCGTGQTLLRELLLVADHTAYHVGQLVSVRRLLGNWDGA
jgi:uncharacterized damage-inducible protein DinB